MENYGASYGAMPGQQYNLEGGGKPFMQGERNKFNLVAIVLSLFVPTILFVAMNCVLSFQVHYDSPGVANFICILMFGLVLVFGYFAYAAIRKKAQGQGQPNWYIFLFVTSLGAWISAYIAGNSNYARNMRPYYDISNLNVYPSIDPATTKGQQLMDMGRATFTKDSRLDLTKSVGFKNLDIYCVAPVVAGNGSMANYDFRAVGLNCCSGHTADFACGEFNNPMAHSGMRLMRDDLRPYFRLAVEQAQASFNINARHPVFLYWMQDPVAEINAYEDAGDKEFITLAFRFIAVQMVLVMLAVVAFSRMSHM
jgi:hypothetical protein